MARALDLLERMRRTPFGWTESDFDRLYRGFGFEVKEGGKHRLYKHPTYTNLRARVGRHKKLAPGYAQDAIQILDELLRLENEETVSEDDPQAG